MQITNLANTSIEAIVDCLMAAFANYFVDLPDDVSFWANRFKNARVDYADSWGVFDQGQLVAFIVNGVGEVASRPTAYNTGTGVLPDYRGQRLVDQMYDFGLPRLRQKGINRFTLEVIDQNARAIRVYERIGFVARHRMKSFSGKLRPSDAVRVLESKLATVDTLRYDHAYSWDFSTATLQVAGEQYTTYEVQAGNQPVGYFIINTANGTLAQTETYTGDWPTLFSGIAQIRQHVRLVNVHEKRTDLIQYLTGAGFTNTIDQLEMEMT